MQPGEMNIDPIEAEFFSTEALGSLADALVREAIQNALDARLPGHQLRFRVLFPPPAAMLEGERKQRYLRELPEHLYANRSGLTKLPNPDEPLDFIVIEDFGTRGLQGDPHQSEDEDIDAAAARNDFYYFWRNIGRSRKHASELGRWGLGKTVFPAASRINSFFAVAIRDDDRRSVLMGQSVLKIHKFGGQRYYPYGYFGHFDNDFALPIEEPALLNDFCRDFQIAREHEPGLSVIVPFPDAELTPQTVISSIIHHYFVPIISGDILVEVIHGGRSERLDAGTLSAYLSRVSSSDGSQIQRLVELTRWGIDLPREQYVRLDAPPETAAPRWNDNCLSTAALAALRDAFNAGQPIAVTVPVWVKPATGSPIQSQFDVYLERDDGLGRTDEHFVRDGITIAGVRGGIPKGIRALVIVCDRPLAELLGDSENPAHTEWQERSPKFKDRYRHGPFTLRYVKNTPREIVRALIRPVQGRDHELLHHLFALDIPTEDTVKDPRKGREDKPGTEDTGTSGGVNMVGKNRFFQLQKLHGGFRLAGTGNGSDQAVPRKAAVWVAYEVRRGNPFRQYQRPDFELDNPPIEMQTEHAEVTRCRGNILVIRIRDPRFSVIVKGFDVHRDIRLRVLGVDEALGE